MNDKDVGKKAALLTIEEVKNQCEAENVGYQYVIRNLKRLSRFKAPKPFSSNGKIIYSKNLPDGTTQLNATRILGEWQGMKPAEEHKITGDLIEPRSPEERKILQDVAKEVAKRLRQKK